MAKTLVPVPVQVWIGECSDFETKEGCDMISDTCVLGAGNALKHRPQLRGAKENMGAFIAFDGVSNPAKIL